MSEVADIGNARDIEFYSLKQIQYIILICFIGEEWGYCMCAHKSEGDNELDNEVTVAVWEGGVREMMW